MSRRAVLVFNPRSGRQRTTGLLPQVLDILRGSGFAVESLPTAGPGDATRLAHQAAEQGVEVIFALGGDGTLREVAAALLGSEVALGPLPAGTTNVLATALGIPREPLAAAAAMAAYEPQRIDVGMVAGDTPFLMMLSGGIDGAVMARQNAALKKRFGKAAVILTGVRELWRYDLADIELCLDGQRDRASFFALCNIPLYGGAFRLAPEADCRDGRLAAVLFRGRGRLATLSFAHDLWRGRHLERPDVASFPVDKAEILGPTGVPLQIDGDVLPAALPLAISVRRRALKILAPSAP
jgi:diacylglycerol kinase (ATP)